MNQPRIYIVEDSLMIAFHLKVALELGCYAVVGMATTGEKALSEISVLKPDLVLLDIMLEGQMDGTQVAAILKESHDIPFIYLTSLSDTESIQRIKRTEPYGYLKKPIDEGEVLNIIEMVLYKVNSERSRREQESSLKSAFDNTSVMVWSVDLDFKIVMANEAFKNHIRKNYGVEIKLQGRILPEGRLSPELDDLKTIWRERYQSAVAGNAMKVLGFQEDRYFDFSISPIVQNQKITGVTVFAEDVTERITRDREMQDWIKQLGELRLSAVRSAMNPHFIFNALNSIQYYIASKDRVKAMQHLSTFSKLLRSILIHSGVDKISLAEELEMLKSYIALELLRFENKFEFVLNVNTQKATQKIELPSLILQPYLENAILHGLSNKSTMGRLELNIHQENEQLNIEIKDNGIGRKAAESLRNGNQSKNSLGLSLGEDRLKLINRNGTVSTADLMDEDGNAAGTSVFIQIQLEQSPIFPHSTPPTRTGA